MSIKPINDREFCLFQELIYHNAGIHLSAVKKGLLEARLIKRIRELGLDSFSAYHEYLKRQSDSVELGELLDRISTNETHFFREPKQFEFLVETVFRQWRDKVASGERAKTIRAWSAGCSTGEEPYSLAMTLIDHFPAKGGWEIEIFATDLSSRALRAARKAVWPIAKAKEVPPGYLKRFMLRGSGSQEGNMKAGPEIIGVVRFARLNLHHQVYPPIGLFDLILCRNVLIYFDARSRAEAIERLVDRLAPGGYLFVGHAESLAGMNERVCYVVPTVYRHAPPEGPAHADAEPRSWAARAHR
ncbi:MAG TPA: protein-glutamate O-methyltransferase CheR [Candidatus Limnocylindria bacterium]|nr:protein-glutamate O-methyltransferase CheR [Candidatus Limnocylindria bacterium]